MEPVTSDDRSGETRFYLHSSGLPTSSSGVFDESTPLVDPDHAQSKPSILDYLHRFRISLQWCALDHSSTSGKIISYIIFIVLGIVIPIVSILTIRVPPSRASGIPFDKLTQLPKSALAGIAFFAVFRRYGLRQLLFVGGLREDTPYVRCGYAKELDRAFRYLTFILLPSFAVELAHKIYFFSIVSVSVPLLDAPVPEKWVMFAAVLASWVYRTGLFLLACLLFRVTCELQILRIEGFRKMLEECESDVRVMFREYIRIKKQLSVTSHRYRVFIVWCLITITASKLAALTLVLASKTRKNFFNAGDLVVCSAVQLSGLFMCLIGAAKITHRAQRIVAVATKWHMLMTWASDAESDTLAKDDQVQAPLKHGLLAPDSASESDAETCIPVPTGGVSNFEARHALVIYLKHNKGGITIFGFMLDRGLLHSLFLIELSLVLWILKMVIVLP